MCLVALTQIFFVASAAGASPPRAVPMDGAYTFTSRRSTGLPVTTGSTCRRRPASGRRCPWSSTCTAPHRTGCWRSSRSGMDASADQNGYLVAYPDGTRIAKVLTPDPVAKQAQYGWNAGQCCGLPVTRHINDVGFLEKVIADIATTDPDRPATGLHDRDLQRRDDGLRHGLRGLRPCGRHLVRLRPGRAAHHPSDPAGAHPRVPQHRRSHRQVGRRPQPAIPGSASRSWRASTSGSGPTDVIRTRSPAPPSSVWPGRSRRARRPPR